MKRAILLSVALLTAGGVGYQFTEKSINSRVTDVVVNADACLFFVTLGERYKNNQIYCSDTNTLRIIKGAAKFGGVPLISDSELKELGDVVMFDRVEVKDGKRVIESASVELYQYGHLFKLSTEDIHDVTGYSLAVNKTELALTYR